MIGPVDRLADEEAVEEEAVERAAKLPERLEGLVIDERLGGGMGGVDMMTALLLEIEVVARGEYVRGREKNEECRRKSCCRGLIYGKVQVGL
jgi:hypothetical protein